MKHKPDKRAASVIEAFRRGKRDAQLKRSMTVPYADREKQTAYERGYRWARLHRQGVTAG